MAALYVSRSTPDRPERRCRGCNGALALAHVQSPGVAGQRACDRSGACRSAGGGRAARRDRAPGGSTSDLGQTATALFYGTVLLVPTWVVGRLTRRHSRSEEHTS